MFQISETNTSLNYRNVRSVNIYFLTFNISWLHFQQPITPMHLHYGEYKDTISGLVFYICYQTCCFNCCACTQCIVPQDEINFQPTTQLHTSKASLISKFTRSFLTFYLDNGLPLANYYNHPVSYVIFIKTDRMW